ncbi:MAG: hypothetical protein QE263_10085 [Vampirovibrionales bacterium]|nr:hypothetical protein [Vampirovibrionales bacterium]
MAKAINWPEAFREAILAETPEQLCVAFRLGTLYSEGAYWQDEDLVDIRCNHLKVRRGQIVGSMSIIAIGQLTHDVLKYQKPSLQTIEAIKAFFNIYYQTAVTDETLLSVAYYRNAPLDEAYMERTPDTSGRQL